MSIDGKMKLTVVTTYENVTQDFLNHVLKGLEKNGLTTEETFLIRTGEKLTKTSADPAGPTTGTTSWALEIPKEPEPPPRPCPVVEGHTMLGLGFR